MQWHNTVGADLSQVVRCLPIDMDLPVEVVRDRSGDSLRAGRSRDGDAGTAETARGDCDVDAVGAPRREPRRGFPTRSGQLWEEHSRMSPNLWRRQYQMAT